MKQCQLTINDALINENMLLAYDKTKLRKKLIVLLLLICVLFVGLFAVTIGPVDISVADVYRVLLHHFFPSLVSPPDNQVDAMVWLVRLPRVLAAIAIGFNLAIAGAVMQPVLRNPMASPFTLGISSGAGFGAAIAIVFGKSVISGSFGIVVNALLFALVSAFLILTISKIRGVTPEMMILIGIALSYLFSAGTTIIQYFADSWATEEIVFWMVGSLSKGTWNTLHYISPVLFIVTPFMLYKSWDLNAMTTGDDTAKSMGVNVERTRIELMVAASLVTAVTICFTGAIGFIGLVAPHITRLMEGGDNRYVVPVSGLVGALLLLISDLVAMNILKPVVIPIGVMTALMGVPLFVFLIIRMKKGYL